MRKVSTVAKKFLNSDLNSLETFAELIETIHENQLNADIIKLEKEFNEVKLFVLKEYSDEEQSISFGISLLDYSQNPNELPKLWNIVKRTIEENEFTVTIPLIVNFDIKNTIGNEGFVKGFIVQFSNTLDERESLLIVFHNGEEIKYLLLRIEFERDENLNIRILRKKLEFGNIEENEIEEKIGEMFSEIKRFTIGKNEKESI